MLNARDETGRLEIARALYARFCADLACTPEVARSRLVAGMQVVMRDAAEGLPTTLFEKSDRPTDCAPESSRDVPEKSA